MGDIPKIDGLALLDEVHQWFGRFVFTMRPEDLDLLTLWAAHTHCARELYTTPRLLIDSPVPGSGKTTVLEHLQRLCRRAVQMSTISSASMLARLLEVEVRTMLIDEADRSLRPDKDGTPDLIATINSGYKRGGTRPTNVPCKGGGWEVREFPTFAPVAMAGNNPNLPDDTRSRTIRVLLLPDITGSVEESDWELIEGAAEALGARLAMWGEQIATQFGERPALPEGVKGRAKECWLPLKRVAVMAGGRWPEAVDGMALAYVDQLEQDREDGLVQTKPAVILLANIAEVWPEGEQFMATRSLVDSLVLEFPTMWGTASAYGKALTMQRLGRMLATGFGINSTRVGDKNSPRGYTLSAMSPIMRRMGVVPPYETGGTGGAGATGGDQTGLPPVAPPPPVPPVQIQPPGKPCRIHGIDYQPFGVCWTCDLIVGHAA